MFEKLIQKSGQLKEKIKEHLAVRAHEKLADIPFANRLFPGAGLAVRAYVRGGDAMMQKALHPDCSFAKRREIFDMAIKEYDLALNLAGRAYGVSKYLNPQAESFRVSCVDNIPPGKLIRTKFGNPIRAASREPFLRELAFRGDFASGCSKEAKSITEMGIDDKMRENFLDRTKFVTQNYATCAQLREPGSYNVGSVLWSVTNMNSVSQLEASSTLFNRIEGKQLTMKELHDVSKQLMETCDQALSLFGVACGASKRLGSQASRFALVQGMLSDKRIEKELGSRAFGHTKSELERLASMGDIASILISRSGPFLDQVGYQLDKVEKNILERTASIIDDYKSLEAWSLSSGGNKEEYDKAVRRLYESLSEATPSPVKPEGISAKKFVEGLTGTGENAKAAAELLQEVITWIKPTVTLDIRQQDAVLNLLNCEFDINASSNEQSLLSSKLLRLINSFEKPVTIGAQPVPLEPPASVWGDGLSRTYDRDESPKKKDLEDYVRSR